MSDTTLGTRQRIELFFDRLFLGPTIRWRLIQRHGIRRSGRIASRAWADYARQLPELADARTSGGRMTVKASAITIGMYRGLLAEGVDEAQAAEEIRASNWKSFRGIGMASWRLARVRHNDRRKRLLSATRFFRRFPFSAPDYQWEEVDLGQEGAGFTCLRCPVAEQYHRQGLGELCVQTVCSLDHDLAKEWGVRLERSGTIAAGAKECDFKWKLNQPEEKGSTKR